jgi:translation initiation factor 2B subunit (eIF-2B alpha/beta/delta family)/ADP-ribose pyrophosphatase YjhB (NUDIX family)
MQETPVVTVFLRNRSDVLLLRRSEAVGSYTGRWGAVAGHVEDDPDESARAEIREETGIDPETETSLRRRGQPFTVDDHDLDTRWLVHPYLFDCETRRVTPNQETDDWTWVYPDEILERDTVPDLWRSYDHVRPRVETIEADREHGSADLSIRALEVLRDEAALAVHRDVGDFDRLRETALALVEARPSMPVLENRVDRVMGDYGSASAFDLLVNAKTAIGTAMRSDSEAARDATAFVDGARIATLSRSGTVLEALDAGDPEAVLIAESRPGGEGVDVASTLADRLDAPVTLTTDAAIASRLETWGADRVVVGADAIVPQAAVRNKVGTRGLATAAAYEGIETVVVAAISKITPDATVPGEPRASTELTDDPSIAVDNPTFEWTPSDLVDVTVTERGELDTAGIAEMAAEIRDWRGWRTN